MATSVIPELIKALETAQSQIRHAEELNASHPNAYGEELSKRDKAACAAYAEGEAAALKAAQLFKDLQESVSFSLSLGALQQGKPE